MLTVPPLGLSLGRLRGLAGRGVAVAMLIVMLAGGCSSRDAESPVADTDRTQATASTPTLVVNATVYTVDADEPWAQAFAFDTDGVIIAVGDEAQVRAVAGDSARVIDAEGAMVLPGFQDAHVHVPEAGVNTSLCYTPASDLALLEQMVTACVAGQPDTEWVRAGGASLFALRDTSELPIDVLDRVVPDRPALILDDLGHAVLTNSLGLEAAGIDADDPNPQGGVFHRDPATGRLTGLLLEAGRRDDEAGSPA